MTSSFAAELCAGYEVMRARATGTSPSETPRGLALFLTQGLPAWIRAWTPLEPAAPGVAAREWPLVVGHGAEVVRLLTEMALGCTSSPATS